MFRSTKIASLRNLLFEMEQELGLVELSDVQRDVYYAARMTAGTGDTVQGEDVRHHPLIARISRPTFYRAVKDLIEAGYISHIDSVRSGRYRLLR